MFTVKSIKDKLLSLPTIFPNVTWGNILGDITNQTDIVNYIQGELITGPQGPQGPQGVPGIPGDDGVVDYDLVLLKDQTDPQTITGMPITDGVTFNTTYIVTGNETIGSLFHNLTTKGLEYKIDQYGTITLGEEGWRYLTNLSGGILLNGDVVSIVGASGNRSAMAKTDTTNKALSLACCGLVTVPSINNNQAGRIVTHGPIRGINTAGFTEGALVYVDCDNAGEYTQTLPDPSCYTIVLGTCTVAHATDGIIDVNIIIYPKLEDLSGVNGTPLDTTGQIPVWNQTSGYFDFDKNFLTDALQVDQTNPQTTIGTFTFPAVNITSAGSTTPLVITKAAQAGVRERLITVTLADAANTSFFVNNGTILDGLFAPVFGGINEASTGQWSLAFSGFATSTSDASNSSNYGLLDFGVFRTTSASDPLNGTLSDIVNRKLFTWRNGTTIKMTMLPSGYLGLGTTAPLALFHISDGNTPASAFVSSDDLVMSKQNEAMGFNISVASTSNPLHRAVFKGVRSRGSLAVPTATAIGDNTFSLLGVAYNGSTFQATAGVNMIVDTTPVSGVSVGQAITFETGTTARAERMRITSGGNVGIGTTTPSSKLKIVDSNSDNNNPTFYVVNNNTTTYNPMFALLAPNAVTGSVTYFSIGKSASNYNRFSFAYNHVADGNISNYFSFIPYGGGSTFAITAGGKVGIGTTEPSARLHAISTTEQLRVGYDISNYLTLTVGSTGAVTFDAVGAGSQFNFKDVTTFGDGGTTNYTKLETDGTMQAIGTATCFRDELNDLIKSASQNPSSHLVFDYIEGTLDFKDNCDLNDWSLMNVQINHDWKSGSDVEPHIHWFQKANNMPNWLIQYRWQKSCGAKTTSWTSVKYTTNACTYVSGTINQITSFGAITPPSGYGISDILQIRILRDTANASTLFAGADPYTGDAEAMSFDVHICVDMLGSRQLYVK